MAISTSLSSELAYLASNMYFDTIFSEATPLRPLTVRTQPNRLDFTKISMEDMFGTELSGYISLIDKRHRDEYITYCAEFTKHDYNIGLRHVFFTDEQDLAWFKLRFS